MRDHAPPQPGGRPRRAAASARPETPASRALALQGTVGNRAAARLLQRVDVGKVIGGIDPDALFQLTVWDQFVEFNRSRAKPIGIDNDWRVLALTYAAENQHGDGAVVRKALNRKPRFWLGGPLIAKAGPDTAAITLDRDVFFNPAATYPTEPHIDTYVHELVHVNQYADLGVVGFLGTYLHEFVRRWIDGKLSGSDADPYHAIVHEVSAKAYENRFSAWRKKREGTDDESVAKQKVEREASEKEIKDYNDAEARRPKPPPSNQPVRIKGSVGAKGDNRPEDVRAIAARLHALGFLESASADVGAVTEAIGRYQATMLKWRKPDRRVDPGGRTLAALGRPAMEVP